MILYPAMDLMGGRVVRLRQGRFDDATAYATDPAEAAAGTVRKLYAESKGRNAIHASDSDENATREARIFFGETELIY